ncbi:MULTISPECIES: gamma carbonic anhydrase family protein [Clostridium]|uniref:Carbonic anhydrase or acetyltransferase, isoleucine patch superfamily n=1 Tax=Clostridium cadaveris TaxID=1529 RepID=A0A1I2J363_9CLOT|nr:gamma carbonic anhydrase family protein [Clostridium cadaveris]MDU4953743.1 gamma carbonic anhydrase family protein [Clostridium sp.]MDM8311379.1 gamma carbonic anhydrase family protein [Clostridium cadaveris]MDY4950531.1 gamma carbonic anhydrase family protein [Clostridium cadaveris]NME63287.1 gamma carbonic anhydrase family protein [Clostridium cadaveris]NWK10175.1 gamma carbonic anhydrase family protein [Clostridium cadaveris]
MIYEFDHKVPVIPTSAFVAKSADVIGDVTLGENVNIWFGAVLRSDGMPIEIGYNTNVQDNCVIHITDRDFPVEIGNNVTIGHGAIIHACKIGNYSLIGMGAIILDGAEIGDYTLIGAGAVVTPGKKIPSGVLCVGSPARVIRELSEEEKRDLEKSADNYIKLAKKYK